MAADGRSPVDPLTDVASLVKADRVPRARSSLAHYLTLGGILFAMSVVGIFLNRRNLIVLLMAIELMLLAVNMNFIAYLALTCRPNPTGWRARWYQFFIPTVAAAESAIGPGDPGRAVPQLRHDRRRRTRRTQGLTGKLSHPCLRCTFPDPTGDRADGAARRRDRCRPVRQADRPRERAPHHDPRRPDLVHPVGDDAVRPSLRRRALLPARSTNG